MHTGNLTNINIRICLTTRVFHHFYLHNLAEIEKSTGNLNSSKVGTFKNIPIKCLKMTSDIYIPFLAAIWNKELILNKKFPQKLKIADITPVCEKDDSTKMKNYRPVSVLPALSKIFERLMQKQITSVSFSLLLQERI